MGMFSKKKTDAATGPAASSDGAETPRSAAQGMPEGGEPAPPKAEASGTAPGPSRVSPREIGPGGKKTVSQVLGEVTWLLTQSPVHKQLFIGDLEWFVMPALLLEQFRMFHGEKHPVAVALWARVSEDTDRRLREGAFKLRPDEWKGGSIPWLIELVAPFGGHEEILADLSAAIFPASAFNYHKVNETGQRVVASYSPAPKN